MGQTEPAGPGQRAHDSYLRGQARGGCAAWETRTGTLVLCGTTTQTGRGGQGAEIEAEIELIQRLKLKERMHGDDEST
jgi:hypothetical protein